MGGTLKGLAKALMIIGVIVCVICFFVGMGKYNEDKDYLEYATVNGGSYYPNLQAAGDNAYAGRLLMIYGGVGVIGSIIGGLPLYWFGCLFERVEDIQSTTYENKRKLEELQKKITE